ncbi:MAG: hypothetical protein IKM62_04135 [Kiritimatiellae bacterium]|nr:hypothetical protein [Kiritimatiellia bacterium]
MKLLWHQTVTKVLDDSVTRNEDIFLPICKGKKISRIVMCDGATASYSAQTWAQLLAKKLLCQPIDNLRLTVSAAAKEYEECFPFTSLIGKDHSIIEAFKRGSSSTLLLLEQDAENSSIIHVTAVGDTCMFVLNESMTILESFPLQCPSEFSTNAFLISTTYHGLKDLFSEELSSYYWKRKVFDFSSFQQVRILCATDAIAQWIMKYKNEPNELNRFFKAIKRNKNDFKRFIRFERAQNRIVEDDSTVAVLEL